MNKRENQLLILTASETERINAKRGRVEGELKGGKRENDTGPWERDKTWENSELVTDYEIADRRARRKVTM